MDEKAMNDLWMLDLDTQTWTMIDAEGAPESRSFHKMEAVGTSLYVFGGCGAKGRLADLHEFDTPTKEWTFWGHSKLRGRGGANLIPLHQSNKLAVVAGFVGEETNDGQVFDLAENKWDDEFCLWRDFKT